VGEYVEEGGGLRWVEGGVCHGVYCRSGLCMGLF
jgi:hypothetical protein